jgi:putative ABC transport system permease protein
MMRRIVAALLYLFPARFRHDFGADMRATFDDRWRERGSWQVAARTIFDLTISAVIQRFSNLPPAAAPARKGDRTMFIFWQDFRFALRTLIKSPAFTLVALTTLALGIGVNTAIFSVANAVLWRSLPYSNPEKIVWVGEVDRRNPDSTWGASYPNYLDWKARSHSFDEIAATIRMDNILREGAEPVRVLGFGVTHEFFEILGVQPALGRSIAASDERPDAPPVILLSDRMWRRRFAADPAILGRTVHFDDSAFTVIGVMPERFEYREAEFWTPIDLTGDFAHYFVPRRSVWVIDTIARLRPGQTAQAAQTEMEAIGQQIRHDFPEINRDQVMRVAPLQAELSRDLRPALVALLGAVAVVLIIACANLAGLMSVRAAARGREMAIRSALGAGRQRMIRQLLTECMTLALFGGLAGLTLAFWATRGLESLTKDPRLHGISIDFHVLLFAFAATVATSLLFGVAPAFHAARADAADALKSGSQSGGVQRAFARQLLVVAQVALCLVLLVGAGLLLRSFTRILDVDPGFRADHLLSLRIGLPNTYKTIAAVTQVDTRFMDALKSLPGVADATMVSSLPISGGDPNGDLTIDGITSAPGELGGTSFRLAPPGFFRTMGTPIVRGREFTASDDRQHEDVVIINDHMARRFWPSQDPIGRKIKIGPRDAGKWLTVVGVSKDVRQVGLDTEIGYATYQPFAQGGRLQMEIAIRTVANPESVISAAQRDLRQIEPAVIVDRVQTMSQRIGDSVAPRRLNLVLFGFFSLLALILASVGLYGVVAYAATRRTREFGIRMALGARSGDVLRLVLGEGLKLTAAGLAIGILAALALTRLLTKLLFGVDPSDPATILGVAALLACVATLACWLPAHRATRILPTEALRSE